MTRTVSKIRERMNYANSIARMGQRSEAIAQYRRALEELEAHPERKNAAQLEAHIQLVLAEELLAEDDVETIPQLLDGASAYFEAEDADEFLTIPAMQRLHYYTKAAKVLAGIGHRDAALKRIRRSERLLASIVGNTEDPGIWDRVLGDWFRVTAQHVELELESGNVAQAISVAEGSKSRLLEWTRRGGSTEAADEILAAGRVDVDLEHIDRWCATEGAMVVSLFGTDDGLAVCAIRGGAREGAWIRDARYQSILNDVYRPWIDVIDDEGSLHDETCPGTDAWLDRVGAWIAEACPTITQGGSELVLIPHRLFRNLPLAHARLPDGQPLAGQFDRVCVVPSVPDLACRLESAALDPAVHALVDPNTNLPHARLEGVLAAGTDRTKYGPDVDRSAVADGIASTGVLLLSSHGTFEAKNPWNSALSLADGSLYLADVLGMPVAVDVLVLGACEAGRQRNAMSDEPIGFSGWFVHAGARTVLAPLWMVDDLATSVFVIAFVRRVEGGEHPASAAVHAAYELRDATASDLDSTLQEWHEAAARKLPSVVEDVDASREWLSQFEADATPFGSARHWAAFQLLGR